MQCGRAPGRVVSSSTDVPPWPLLLLTLLTWPSASAKHCGFTSGLRQKPQTWATSQSRNKDEVVPLCISMAHTADVPTVAAVARTRSRRMSISVPCLGGLVPACDVPDFPAERLGCWCCCESPSARVRVESTRERPLWGVLRVSVVGGQLITPSHLPFAPAILHPSVKRKLKRKLEEPGGSNNILCYT